MTFTKHSDIIYIVLDTIKTDLDIVFIKEEFDFEAIPFNLSTEEILKINLNFFKNESNLD